MLVLSPKSSKHLTEKISSALASGLQRHQTVRLPEAESCYRKILSLNPDHPAALHRGVLAQQTRPIRRRHRARQLLQHRIQIIHLKIQHGSLRHRKILRTLRKERDRNVGTLRFPRKPERSRSARDSKMLLIPRIKSLRIRRPQKRSAQPRNSSHKNTSPFGTRPTISRNIRMYSYAHPKSPCPAPILLS